jgi:hypothetical protein
LAVFPDHRIPVDLDGEPDALICEWMEILDQERKERAAVPVVEIEED